MQKNIKIILGANYGDEGKGRVTDYLARRATDNGESCLNILYNGGSQRGHTVITEDGKRHVFKHFGSGTYAGADTFFHSRFIVNPMDFVKEYEELGDDLKYRKIWISPQCRVATPFDVILNQALENSRGIDRHGSCGCGIWETMQRYKTTPMMQDLFWMDMSVMSIDEMRYYLKTIARVYMMDKFEEYGISADYIDGLDINGLINHYIEDFTMMNKVVTETSECELYRQYDAILFEGGQGLLLSSDRTNDYPHVTTSITGIKGVPCSLLPSALPGYDINIEVFYVSRTYMTRHGAGPLVGECEPDEIGDIKPDMTNKTNTFQGPLRYAPLNEQDLIHRIEAEIGAGQNVGIRKASYTLCFTHCDEVSPPDIWHADIHVMLFEGPVCKKSDVEYWIYGEDEYGIDGYSCSKCGFFIPWDYTHRFIDYISDYKFCPACGKPMRGDVGR